jgi:hypothetical protein
MKANKGCQYRFGRCFVFSIGTECFGFGAFRRAVSGLYCSSIYIYIQDKLIINYALQSTNTMSSKHNFKILNISK